MTAVLDGLIDVEHDDGVIHVRAGQAVITRAGERIRYTTREGARYVAVCVPAFHGELLNRDGDYDYGDGEYGLARRGHGRQDGHGDDNHRDSRDLHPT